MSGSVYHPEKFKRPSDEGPAADLSSYEIIENTDAAQLRDINQKLFARLSELRERNLELRKFEELSWEKDLELVKLRSIEADLRKQLTGIRNDVEYNQQSRDAHLQEIGRLRFTIEKHDENLQHEKDEYNRKLARILDQSWEKDFEIKSLGEQIEILNQNLESLHTSKAHREAQLAASHQQVVKLTKALAENSAEIERLEERAQAQSAQFSDKFAEACGRREDEIQRLLAVQADLKSVLAKHEGERDGLQDDIKSQSRNAWELQSKIDALKLEISNLIEDHQTELKRAGDEYASAIKRVADDHAVAVSRMKEERAKEIALLTEQNAARIQSVQTEAERKISNAREKADVEVEGLREIERDLNEQITRLRIESNGQARQIETLNQSITDLRSSLLAEQNRVETAKIELQARVDELRQRDEDLHTLRSAEAMLSAELTAEKEARRRSDARSDESQTRQQDLARQLADLRDRLAVREESHRNSQRVIDDLEKKVASFEIASESWKTGQTKMSFEINQERLKRQEDAIEAKRLATDAASKIKALETSVHTLEIENAKVLETAKKEIAALEHRRASEADAAEARHTKESATNEARHEAELTATNARHFNEMATAKGRHEAQILEFERVNSELRATVQAQKENDAQLLAEISDCRYEIKKMKDDLHTAEERHALEMTKSESEQATLRRLLGARTAANDSTEKELERREEQMAVREQQVAARENQLRHYASAVTEQKAELVRQTRLLADEIQMSSKMHPLIDYLKVTEFELSKAEVQLKVTPTLSADRARLESVVKQMSEQRDFLRNVVRESTTRLDQQAENILALVKSPKLIATPPLPPTIRPKTAPVAASAAPVKTSTEVNPDSTKGPTDFSLS